MPVSRQAVLRKLGVAAEDSAEIDGLLEQVGGDLMVAPHPQHVNPPALYYVVPQAWVEPEASGG